MRVLICGGRNYADVTAVALRVSKLPEDTTVITGGAHGADTLADIAAMARGFPTEIFYANWEKYGKDAGRKRNQEMLDSGVDLVIAFPGGYGTADMKRRARKAGVEVEEIDE